jgi:FkbM family methyltransferase
MMEVGEIIRFLDRHYKSDTKTAFICRLLRMGLLAMPVLISEHKANKIKSGYNHGYLKAIWGNIMCLDTNDAGIGTDLILCDKREPLICQKFRKILKDGMVVYDIGANIGYYALQEARLVGEKGFVYAIEPVPHNKHLLELNISLNNFKNIKVYECAMGEKDGDSQIKLTNMSNISTMVEQTYRDIKDVLPVKVQTLDTFMKGKRLPDVIRMDTEGYEVNIIQGMSKLFKSNKPLILFIEIHFDALKEKVVGMLKTLKENGFDVKYASHETHPIIQNSWIKPLVNLCEKGMGASGYLDVTIDDLMTQKRFLSGQVENLEVIFERK